MKTEIKAALKQADGNIDEASAILARHAHLRAKLLDAGAHQVIRSYLGAERRPSFTTSDLPHEVARKFMERYTLFGGALLLADATWKDLADSARQHDSQALGHQNAAAFERAVGQIVKKTGKRVRDVIPDQKLKDMAKEFKQS